MKNSLSKIVTAFVVSLLSVSAFAQNGPPQGNDPYAYPPQKRKSFSPEQVAILIGGGPSNYFGGTQFDSHLGGMWNARILVGTRSFIALEANYIGTYNDVSGSLKTGHLLANGVDGDFRFNIIPWRIDPYLFVGLGYNHLSLDRNGDPGLLLAYHGTAEQLTVPAGAGISIYVFRHLTADVRFTYRAAFLDNLGVKNSSDPMSQWNVGFNIGYAF